MNCAETNTAAPPLAPAEGRKDRRRVAATRERPTSAPTPDRSRKAVKSRPDLLPGKRTVTTDERLESLPPGGDHALGRARPSERTSYNSISHVIKPNGEGILRGERTRGRDGGFGLLLRR